ncbi:MAG: NAD-dependent epimerase/dehydratase family protein [Candidatus Latescibacteria bacterium]|nr:NAD-dependent epimerase/dehydratase family protein [Candidatus Latescibacterota bacterium]
MERVLIAGAAGRLGREIARVLEDDYQVRLFDAVGDGEGEWVLGEPVDPEAAGRALEGVDALILTGEPPLQVPADEVARDEMILDWATRGTHVLCTAAVEEGVKRIVYGGTLEVFAGYPDTVYISEMHKPLPGPEIYSMARYLGELTCREFARDHRLTATGLRLGKLVCAEEVDRREADYLWLDRRDAAQAFQRALPLDRSEALEWNGRWALYHIAAEWAKPKFLIDRARSMGYEPEYHFEGGRA